MQITPLTVELPEGLTDENGKHTTVEFGRIVKAAEFFFIEMLWQGAGETILSAHLLSSAITRFGTTTVTAKKLLSLYLDEFNELVLAFEKFSQQNGLPAPRGVNALKLVYGYEKDGERFDVVEFGRKLNAVHKDEADEQQLSGNSRAAFLAGKQVLLLRQSGGDAVLEGELSLEQIGEMYLIDAIGLIQFCSIWRKSVDKVKGS